MTEDITNQISIRNLEVGGGPRTPLRKFKGRLEKYNTYTDTWERTQVKLHFTQLEVEKSDEPYDLPIAEIDIPFSKREKSRWGIFSNSLAKFLQPDQDIVDSVGTELEMSWTDGHMLYDGRENKDTLQASWEVTGLKGTVAETKVDAMTRALELLNKKTLSQFNSDALSDPVIRSDETMQKSIMDGSFVTAVVEGNQVTVDADGVYHKVS